MMRMMTMVIIDDDNTTSSVRGTVYAISNSCSLTEVATTCDILKHSTEV